MTMNEPVIVALLTQTLMPMLAPIAGAVFGLILLFFVYRLVRNLIL